MPSRPVPGDLAPRRGLLLVISLSLLVSAPSARAQPAEPARPAAALDAILDQVKAWVQALHRGAAAGAPPHEVVVEATAARERIAELEATNAESAATIAQLHAELARSQAEVQWLREELEASWRWIEELNTVLNSGGAGNRLTREEPSADGTAEARTTPAGAGEAVYYAATRPVNLHAGPTNDAEVLAVVGAGELVRRIGHNSSWLRVRYVNRFATEFTGWVHGNFLRGVAAPQPTGPIKGS
jgi:hypothetical protein